MIYLFFWFFLLKFQILETKSKKKSKKIWFSHKFITILYLIC